LGFGRGILALQWKTRSLGSILGIVIAVAWLAGCAKAPVSQPVEPATPTAVEQVPLSRLEALRAGVAETQL
jgi:uncharacterized lipoprotein YajG